MSLLGNNVFANPTTPLWGQGGGGGGGSNFQTLNILQGGNLNIGSSINQGTNLNFYKDISGTTFTQLSMGYIPDIGQPSNLHLTVADQAGDWDTLAAGDILAYGTGNGFYAPEALSIGTDGGGLGIRVVNPTAGTTYATCATFAQTGVNLSNVLSINGVPYALLPATRYDYQEFPGGVDVSAAPAWGALNTLTITPPVNGKISLQSQGSFVSQIIGGGVGMTFAINGSNISELPASVTAFQGNTNVPLTNLYSFPVSANVPYTIQSVAQRSVVPPEPGTDMVVIASRLFLSFSPQ